QAIHPGNILINPRSRTVKITDFALATKLPENISSCVHPEWLQTPLVYASPEQTGRIDRGADHRSDLYSLGATFYEMLAAQPPFETRDPLELVHCHLTKSPVALRNVNPAIPQPLSDLVSKLLAKAPEDRYQSAYGVACDLRRCLEDLQYKDTIGFFQIGEKD